MGMHKKPNRMNKSLISSREQIRRMQKRTMIASLSTMALSILGLSFGIEENGGTYDKHNQFPAIYGMNLSGNGGDTAATCTAFLVHPQLLLTAAHCAYEFGITNISNAPNINGGTRKYSNPRFDNPVLLPKYKELRPGRRASDPALMQYDFAYIRLRKPVYDVVPLTIKSLHDLPESGALGYIGKSVITTGYGVTISRGANGDYSEDSKGFKRFGSAEISDVSGYMLTLPGLKGNILPGDSGGPLLMQENGQTFVIGVNQSIRHGGPGGAYSEAHALGLRKEIVCWALRDSGLAIAGINCP